MPTTINGGLYRREASFIPDSINKEKRTITFCWSTGSRVLRVPWFDDPFYEELSMDAEHIRLNRLNNAAPFLKMHRSYDLYDSIGVHERAWVENGKGFAEVRFSKRADVESLWGEVCDGILRNISVGYMTHEIDKTKKKGSLPIHRAIDWEPYENSLVLIGADADAQIRSQEKKIYYPIHVRSKDMSKKVEETEVKVAGDPLKTEGGISPEQMQKIRSEELSRISEINNLCERHQIPSETRDQMITGGVSIIDARSQILDYLTKKSDETRINPRQSARIEAGSYEERDVFRDGVENSILHKISPSRHPLSEKGRRYITSSLMDLAKEEQELRGERVRGATQDSILTRSFMSTSDFPILLSNIANKELVASYQEQMKGQTFRPLVQEKLFDNFKPKTSVRYGEMPDLQELGEGEEITFDTLGESGEQWTIGTFARGTQITRKAIIDNDLDSFSMLYNWTRAILRLESRIVWGLFKDHTMSDGHKVFDRKKHGNLSASGSELNVKSMASAIYEMSMQQGINKRPDDYLDIAPSYLVVPSLLDHEARRFIYEPYSPTELAETNPYRNRFQVISEPRLNVAPGKDVPWYLATKPSDFPVIYVGYYSGARNPVIDWEVSKRTRGMNIYCFYDFGATVADFRGLYKNPGVKVEL